MGPVCASLCLVPSPENAERCCRLGREGSEWGWKQRVDQADGGRQLCMNEKIMAKLSLMLEATAERRKKRTKYMPSAVSGDSVLSAVRGYTGQRMRMGPHLPGRTLP